MTTSLGGTQATTPQSAADPDAGEASASPAYRRYLLTLLLVTLAFNYVDRQILALVLEDLKQDLKLSDTELGLLSGIAFTLFYATLGIPIARLADRGDRVRIIGVATAIWTVFVCACGLVTNFIQLLMMRIGVAIGEAGCLPPSSSLLSDYFPRKDRARAFAIYSLGSPLSVLIGFFCAGWINQFYGWRVTFIVLGLPGLALAILVATTLREPRRRTVTEQTVAPTTSVWVALHHLLRIPTFRHLILANTALYFFIYGITLQWQPAFFIRSHGMSTGELGTWYLVALAGFGGIGTYLGGVITGRMGHNERSQLLFMMWCMLLYGALSLPIYLTSSKYVALTLVVASAPFYTAIFGPLNSIVQTLVGPNLRATATSILLFVANLLGMGFGGLGTGMLSDLLAPHFGSDALRIALLVLTPGFFLASFFFLLAARTVRADIARIEADS